MSNAILAVLVLIIIGILLWPSRSANNTCAKSCYCPKCRAQAIVEKRSRDLFPNEEPVTQRGLNDLEQTPISRGYKPYQNQPDHIANLWKCEYSHPGIVEGAGCLDTVFASDYPTPLRGAVVKQNVSDTYNSHLVSRFAGIN